MAALGRPREGDGLAPGRPREGDGKLDSDTADASVGKLLRCSLWEGTQEEEEEEGGGEREVTIVLDVPPCARDQPSSGIFHLKSFFEHENGEIRRKPNKQKYQS